MKRLVMVFTMGILFSVSTSVWAQTNINIVDKARSYEGQIGWTCKEFVQYVINQIGGNLGSGYRDCYFEAGFTEVTTPQSGDVIQTSNPLLNYAFDETDLNGDGKPDRPYHSAFCAGSVEGVPNDYWVVDSNRIPAWGRTVAYDDWNPYTYVANKPGHQVYFYRLVVGRNSDGSNCKEFLQCYYKHGGLQTLGLPVTKTIDGQGRPNTVWEWEVCSTQVFDGGELGECAIVYDCWVNCGKAFPMHGQLWNYYKANHGPYLLIEGTRIGGPIDQEKYATDNYNDHQLAVQQMANGWLVYDTVTGFCDAVSDNSGFRLATIPGDGQTLTLLAYAQSSTSAYLTVNAITGASSYQAYQNGSYLGDLTGLALTVGNLTANTAYTFQVKAVAIDGTVLAVSNAKKITY